MFKEYDGMEVIIQTVPISKHRTFSFIRHLPYRVGNSAARKLPLNKAKRIRSITIYRKMFLLWIMDIRLFLHPLAHSTGANLAT